MGVTESTQLRAKTFGGMFNEIHVYERATFKFVRANPTPDSKSHSIRTAYRDSRPERDVLLRRKSLGSIEGAAGARFATAMTIHNAEA